MSASVHLQKQFRELQQRPLGGFRIELENDDLMKWTVWFAGPKDSLYFPGQYKAQLLFNNEFPMKPPVLRIVSNFWHPNVYNEGPQNGNVCMSVLHPPGTDEMNTLETAMMRWTPIQTIEKVLVAFISLLSDPDPTDAGAPANVDALAQFRKDRHGYVRKCQDLAQQSLRELPPNYVPPPENDAPPVVERMYSAGFSEVYQPEEVVAAEPAVPYASELAQIRDMGAGADKSDEELLKLLEKFHGDVSVVLEKLWE